MAKQRIRIRLKAYDHRLLDQIRAINHYFAYFLFTIDEFL